MGTSPMVTACADRAARFLYSEMAATPKGVDRSRLSAKYRTRPTEAVWYLRCGNWNGITPTRPGPIRVAPSCHRWRWSAPAGRAARSRSEEHTSELQSHHDLV